MPKKLMLTFFILLVLSFLSISATGSDTFPTPVAAFTGSPRTSGAVPLTVRFTDLSTGTGPLTYAWDFNNDGTIDSTVQNPSYTYTSVGSYAVNLTVMDAGGQNITMKPGYITLLTPQPITGPILPYNFINLYMANDEGVKYDEPNGVQASGTYNYIPNTYYLAMYGGMNSEHMSTDPSNPAGQVSTTTNLSGTFWIAQTGGQPTMYRYYCNVCRQRDHPRRFQPPYTVERIHLGEG